MLVKSGIRRILNMRFLFRLILNTRFLFILECQRKADQCKRNLHIAGHQHTQSGFVFRKERKRMLQYFLRSRLQS